MFTVQTVAWLLCMAVNSGLVTDVRYSHGFRRRLSNGETESAKTMLVEDSESDQALTPSKDGTLVIRQVRGRDRHLTHSDCKLFYLHIFRIVTFLFLWVIVISFSIIFCLSFCILF